MLCLQRNKKQGNKEMVHELGLKKEQGRGLCIRIKQGIILLSYELREN